MTLPATDEEPIGGYRSLTQIVVERLRDGIFDGDYAPGARLNIADLAQQFNVSPVPVREALRNLESEGLVRFRLNKGAVVRELSADEVRELYIIRLPLETLATITAARRAQPQELAALEALLAEMDAAMGSERWHALHGGFHQRINALARLPRLAQLSDLLRGQMRPYSRTYLNDRAHIAQAQAEHYQILAAMRARDEARLRALTREHLRRPAQLALTALGTAEPLEFEPVS
jgi:DNA-binding GntR family transcriptional regulator